MTITFHIRLDRLHSETEKALLFIASKKKTFWIPKSQIISMKSESGWIELVVTKWIWDKANLYKVLSRIKESGDAKFKERPLFNIDWDFVIERSKDKDHCFFCTDKMDEDKRTKDHLIPTMVLKAYGIKSIKHNKVPCCYECNQEKAYLMPDIFRRSVKLKLHETGKERYKENLKTLNRLIYYESNDDFAGGERIP